MITFKETGLNPELIHAITELGFEEPTPVQEKTIPVLLNNSHDLIALAQTGTGKTAAFGLPLIQLTDIQSDKVQALVLCPTRELCMQITNDIENYAKFVKTFEVTAVYGGASIETQIRKLKRGTHIVVGTPGRVYDLIRRKVLKIKDIRWLVLDEADEMLNMGFQEDLDSILADTPTEKQTLLFSATMPDEIRKISEKYMHNTEQITIGKKNVGAENVSHIYYMVSAKDRYEALKRIADINPNIYGLVFCRTRQETKDVADKLIGDGYNADALHGDLSQAQRDHVMNRFRMKTLQLLVATDVAARGLDVNDLSHVINYNLPDDLDIYIHRIGRTGRAGKKGIAMTIIHSREFRKIKELEKLAGKKFEHKPVPGGKQICEKQLFNFIDKVEKVEVDETQIEQFIPDIYKKLNWLERDDLIKHFVSIEFNRFLTYYKNSSDLNVQVSSSSRYESDSRPRRDRKTRDNNRGDQKHEGYSERRSSSRKFSRFFINVGSNNEVGVNNIIGMINDFTRNRDITIGKIDIMKKFSFFEVESNYENEILDSFKGASLKGYKLSVELSKPDIHKSDKSVPYKEKQGYQSEKKDYKGRKDKGSFKKRR
ncbi:MAG: DEAD/DEAH box helicase [Bacteroidota bacterium]